MLPPRFATGIAGGIPGIMPGMAVAIAGAGIAGVDGATIGSGFFLAMVWFSEGAKKSVWSPLSVRFAACGGANAKRGNSGRCPEY